MSKDDGDDYFYDTTRTVNSRKADREELQQLIDEYLSRGGMIKQCPNTLCGDFGDDCKEEDEDYS